MESPQSQNRTVWLLLSYAWIAACCVALPAIPLVIERDDEFAKWHAKHGLLLASLWFLVSLVLLLMGNLLGLAWEPLKATFYMIWGVVGAGFLVVCIIALMKAFEGERWTLKPLETLLNKLS